jgi:hypothetical protein
VRNEISLFASLREASEMASRNDRVLGQLLADKRQEMGLFAFQVADYIKVDSTLLLTWELGKFPQPLTAIQIQRLANVLRLDPDEVTALETGLANPPRTKSTSDLSKKMVRKPVPVPLPVTASVHNRRTSPRSPQTPRPIKYRTSDPTGGRSSSSAKDGDKIGKTKGRTIAATAQSARIVDERITKTSASHTIDRSVNRYVEDYASSLAQREDIMSLINRLTKAEFEAVYQYIEWQFQLRDEDG